MISEQELRMLFKISPEKAHRMIFNQYSNYVYAIVFSKLRSCASREDIDECVSDIFAEIFIHYDPDHTGSLQGYIGTIARRTAISAFYQFSGKSKSGQMVSFDSEEIPDLPSDADIEQDYEKKALRKLLLDKIAELGEPDATIIIQKYFYHEKSEDIARLVSLTPANVRKRSERALRKLKSLLTKEDLL